MTGICKEAIECIMSTAQRSNFIHLTRIQEPEIPKKHAYSSFTYLRYNLPYERTIEFLFQPLHLFESLQRMAIVFPFSLFFPVATVNTEIGHFEMFGHKLNLLVEIQTCTSINTCIQANIRERLVFLLLNKLIMSFLFLTQNLSFCVLKCFYY